MSSGLKVYYASVTGSLELRKQQERIFMVLDSSGYVYEKIDVTQQEGGEYKARAEMRQISGIERALPPQFIRGSEYLGDYDAFEAAIEDEDLKTFLRA